MYHSDSSQTALVQISSIFTQNQKRELNDWLSFNYDKAINQSQIYGHPYSILNMDEFGSIPELLPEGIAKQHLIVIAQLKKIFTPSKQIYYIKNCLIFTLSNQLPAPQLRLVLIPEEILNAILHNNFAPENFTGSEIRVLAQLISDPEIKRAANMDNVQVSTKETHYKSAARKMQGHKRIGVIANLTAQLLLEVTIGKDRPQKSSDTVFNTYREKYLPEDIRVLVLSEPGGKPHRILDMGPQSGKPAVVLHPMVLPDIREQDIQLLYKINLRLMCPLRNGLLESDAPTLSAEEHLEDCIEGIELIHQYFCTGPFVLTALVTSSWFAVRYAHRFPEKIAALIFVTACNRQNKSTSPCREFVEGLIALAAEQNPLTNLVLSFARKHFSQHKHFQELMSSAFNDNPHDMQILKQDFSRSGVESRYFFSLSHSLPSIQHDLSHQKDLGWSIIKNCEIPAHFVHGENDTIDRLEDIKRLAEQLPNGKVHALPNCGQLVYYQHFTPVARLIAELS